MSPGREPRIVRMQFTRVSAGTASREGMKPEGVVRAQVRAFNEGNVAAAQAFFAPDARYSTCRVMPIGSSDPQCCRALHAGRSCSMRFPRETSLSRSCDSAMGRHRQSPNTCSRSTGCATGSSRTRGMLREARKTSQRTLSNPKRSFAELAGANNRGDVEAFLALFSPRAKNFRNSGDPHALGGEPSVTMVDAKGRREAY